VNTNAVPLVDLAAQHAEVAEEVDAGFSRVLETSAFILGGDVGAFEEAFAHFCGVRYCVGVANGTDALELALRALDIGTGDEVILPANTFIATALAVARAGATPVLVDSDPVYHLIDVERVPACLGPHTKAVIVVDLFGQVGPFDELGPRLADSGVILLEDAAQAQGARHHGVMAGGFGTAAGTSFYPGKNLGAYGDAGALLSNSSAVATRVRALRNYGSDVKYHHPETGFNSRLDTLQAVVLRAKLRRLEAWNAARREAAQRYDELLAAVPEVVRPATRPGNEHAWHLYVVRVPRRDEVLRRLNNLGIGAGVHYPVPIHLQGAFRSLGHRPGAFPTAEKAAKEILSLPMFPHITPAQQERVVTELREAIEDRHAS
jgi:dTDP-4-amino-4,6-dideoxygalactose transaminase